MLARSSGSCGEPRRVYARRSRLRMKRLIEISWRSVLAHRSLVSIAIAGCLAVAVSARLAKRMRASASGDEVSRLERGLLPMRQKLHLGDVVGMLVADEDDGLDRWFQTQYALVPATVVRVRVRECARGSAPTACAKGATHLLVLGKTIDEAAALGASFGFNPAIVSTGGILLARNPR